MLMIVYFISSLSTLIKYMLVDCHLVFWIEFLTSIHLVFMYNSYTSCEKELKHMV